MEQKQLKHAGQRRKCFNSLVFFTLPTSVTLGEQTMNGNEHRSSGNKSMAIKKVNIIGKKA